MAAHLQPSVADVDMFLDLVGHGVSRDVAIRRLKGNNNNVEQALNEYYEDPASESKYSWDESQFSSDRDGDPNGHGISFNIQGADDLGPQGGRHDGTLSRPPSRTSNNRSPLGKIIDLTAEHARADPRMSMTTQEQHDRELQQALAASLADAGLPPQEEGITGLDEPHFGPATRTDYESGKWEMVTVGKSSVQEIVVDPEPMDRKRDLDAPAFLKPMILPINNRLNALITIYHEIPMMRNVFLNITDVLDNYGYNKEWWAGQPIVLPSRPAFSDDDDHPPNEVAQELQRLMAFLDKTERAYGSVDALANLDQVKRAQRMGPEVEGAVLNAWKAAFENTPHRAMTKTIFSAGVQSLMMEDRPTEFAILELGLPLEDSLHETLYDIADEVMWPGLGNLDLSEAPYLSHIAEVIAFRVEGGVEHKRVDIPAVWYPDRYLKNSREAALEMRKKKRVTAERLDRIVKLESQLTYVPLRTGKIVTVKNLFNASLKHDEDEIKENGVKSEDDLMDADPRPSKTAVKLSDELRKVLASIDKKLTALGEAKKKACEEMRNLSKLYTEPSDDPFAPKLKKYTLRGVSTNKHTMYICRRAEPDLIDMDLDSDGPKDDGDQWWRIHYAPAGHSPVTVEKTTEEKVLDAAKNDSNNTILVYASEKALNSQRIALPKALDNFVRWDNASFKAEFPDTQSEVDISSPVLTEDSQSSVTTSQVGPSSPGKRKYGEEDGNISRARRINITERELEESSSNESASTMTAGMSNGTEHQDLIIGVDPALVTKQEEMQERSGMPILGGRPLRGQVISANTIDSMDLDQVVQEDENAREESAAVKRVGFVE